MLLYIYILFKSYELTSLIFNRTYTSKLLGQAKRNLVLSKFQRSCALML
jgi:hypothetical protein